MRESDAEPDFFVSYASKDESRAEWIARELVAANYTVTLQKWDFRAGTNFVLNMHDALSTSARTIAVLSPAYLESEFTRAEWTAAYARDPTGAQRTLIPVRVAECQLTGLWRSLTYVDLVGRSTDEARELLLREVRDARTKPDRSPEFLGSRSGSPSSAVERPDALPRYWTVPFRTNPFFTGRQDPLERIGTVLRPGRHAAVALSGLGGMGKTQLAVHYAWNQRGDYDAVLWVSAETVTGLGSQFASLTREEVLGLPELLEKDQQKQIDAVLRWLRGHSRWLLIFDSVDSAAASEAVIDLVKQLPVGHVLVTSRRSSWPITIVPVEINRMPEREAVELLLKRTASPQVSTPNLDAIAVASALDGLPLALEQAAAYIAHKRTTFRGYLAALQASSAEVLKHGVEGATEYPRSVFATWHVTESELSPEGRAVLRLSCFLAPEPIPRNVFVSGSAVFNEALRLADYAATANDVPSEAAIRGLIQLADYSLVELTPTAFSFHRLLITAQREALSVEERRAWLPLALRLIDGAAPTDPDEPRALSIWETLQPHVIELMTRADELGVTQHAARLMSLHADFLYKRARFSEAESLVIRAIVFLEATYGPEHPIIAPSLNTLAMVMRETERFSEAEPHLRRALAINENAFGAEHPDVAFSLSSLAVVLNDMGNVSEAEPIMRRALAISERQSPSSYALARDLNNLALLLDRDGRAPECESLMRRALEIAEANYSADHPEVAVYLSNLGLLLLGMNQLEQAEQFMRRAIALIETRFGPESPVVARVINNLALLMMNSDRLDEAEPLYRRALGIFEASYGHEHPVVAHALRSLVSVLQASDRFEEARPLLQRSISIEEGRFGPEFPEATVRLRILAQLSHATGGLDDAEKLLRRVLASDEARFGSNDSRLAVALTELASVLSDHKQLVEAESLYRRALALVGRDAGDSYIYVGNLATVLLALGRFEEAEVLMREALAANAKLGRESSDVATLSNNLAQLLERTGRPREALELAQRALSSGERHLGADHPTVESFRKNLSGTARAVKAAAGRRNVRLIQGLAIVCATALIATFVWGSSELVTDFSRPATLVVAMFWWVAFDPLRRTRRER